MSAGGSVKDRIAKAMVEAAEKDGRLIKGKSIVIEVSAIGESVIPHDTDGIGKPTSGNTGLDLDIPC